MSILESDSDLELDLLICEKELVKDIEYHNIKENNNGETIVNNETIKNLQYAYIKIYCNMMDSTIKHIIDNGKIIISATNHRQSEITLKSIVFMSFIYGHNIIYEQDHFIIMCKLEFENLNNCHYMTLILTNIDFDKCYKYLISYCENKTDTFVFVNFLLELGCILLKKNKLFTIDDINRDYPDYFYYPVSFAYGQCIKYNDSEEFDDFSIEITDKYNNVTIYNSFNYHIDNMKYIVFGFIEDIFDAESLEHYIKKNLHRDMGRYIFDGLTLYDSKIKIIINDKLYCKIDDNNSIHTIKLHFFNLYKREQHYSNKC